MFMLCDKVLCIRRCVLVIAILSIGEAAIVETSNGKVVGRMELSRGGKSYHAFFGIPYATPPINDLRYEPPQEVDNWTGIKDGLMARPPCIQFEGMFTKRVTGKEDCLYLNVFTPHVPEEGSEDPKLLPVMIFIHGGGYFSGNPRTYRGKYFMDEDVVIVTFACRLASFGFLSSGDNVIRGNQGLKDQLMVLKWVQAEIRHFGGDAGSVTLFGESSGGSSVHLHLLSPKSKGLFHRGISQTGTSLRRYPNTKDFEGQMKYLASGVGCPTNGTTQEIVECLKLVDAVKIAEFHSEVQDVLRGEYSIFGPIVEPIKDDDAFLTAEPEVLLSTGNFSRLPWITGINSADGIIFATEYMKSGVAKARLDSLDGWLTYAHKLLRFDDNDLDGTRKASEKIRRFYFGDGLPSDPKNFVNLINMFSDRMYFLPMYNTIKLQAPKAPVYLYYFDYKTVGSIYKVVDAVDPNMKIIPPELQIAGYFVRSWFNETILRIDPPWYGAAHADELFLLFNVNFLLEARQGTPDYEPSRKMVKAWADFAKTKEYRVPLYYGDNIWPPVSSSVDTRLWFLHITKEPGLIEDPIEKRMRFWKSLNLSFLGNPL